MPEAPLPIRRLLIANRGEIALRVIRTAHETGIDTVAVHSDVDRNALHVRRAHRAVRIGPPPPAESYLNIAALIDAARATDCDAVHPGYGFLSENAAFAEACADAGLTFVGPPADAIRAMGDKLAARRIAEAAKVPLVPGLLDAIADLQELARHAREIGYPVMLKAAAGGGGKGIRIVRNEKELAGALSLARNEAKNAFADDRVYLEKLVTRPRHVEIQVMADRHGRVVHYGERECSVQRRHQKLVEESPCAVLTPELREQMGTAACRLAAEVGYVGAGTVEFLYSEGRFYFLEMNTRLQVEHPITEERYGVDLVREQLRVAAGLEASTPGEPRGHAIEIRVNAEDPDTFFPSLGKVTRLGMPGGPGVRCDSALYRGLEITPHYDSMLAKLIVSAPDRAQAIARAERCLREFRLVGVTTSLPVALRALRSAEFRSGDYDTGILERVDRAPPPELCEIGSLAAAVAKYVGTERAVVAAGNGSGTVPMWTLLDRVERLGRRPS
jgi:acetyl-CoA carboxylase biotin carboxylase subunit